MSLSIEERYDEVRQLITVGKEKAILLHKEASEILAIFTSIGKKLKE